MSPRSQPPGWRFVPPALVVLGVLTYVALGQSRDALSYVFGLVLVVLPGAVLFLGGYVAGYVSLRRRQLAGLRPRSGAAVVALAVIIAATCVAFGVGVVLLAMTKPGS